MSVEAWIAIIGLIVTVIVAIITAAIGFQKAADRSEANRAQIDDIHRRKAEMRNDIKHVFEELGAFKEYVASHFAPMTALERMEERLMKMLEAIAKRLDRKDD